MGIPEHDKYIKLKKRYRKDKKIYYKNATNNIPKMHKKRIRRKLTIYYAEDTLLRSKSRLQALKLSYKRLIDYYRALFGQYYRKLGKYKS